MKHIITLLLILLPVYAGAYDLDGGRPNGMGGAAYLSEPDGSDLNLCPTLRIDKKRLLVSSGWQRKFELAEFDQVYLTGGYRTGRFSFTGGFSQFGKSGYYTEKVFRAALSCNFDYFAFGLIGSGKELEIGANGLKLRAASLGISAGTYYKRYYFGMVLDNINGPKLAELAEKDKLSLDLFAEIDGGEYHSITGRMRLEKGYDPILSLAQYIHLTDKQALFWGISHNPLTYGGGLEFEYKGFSIVYSANYHNTLGFTHNVSLNYSGGGGKAK